MELHFQTRERGGLGLAGTICGNGFWLSIDDNILVFRNRHGVRKEISLLEANGMAATKLENEEHCIIFLGKNIVCNKTRRTIRESSEQRRIFFGRLCGSTATQAERQRDSANRSCIGV
jgi:hypothetical protein